MRSGGNNFIISILYKNEIVGLGCLSPHPSLSTPLSMTELVGDVGNGTEIIDLVWHVSKLLLN